MAEALGVAGSVVSFIGLAGQVAQGVNYLCAFFDSVQDAPSDIRSLSSDLKVLGTILDEVGRDGIESASLTAALKRCKDVIEDLESLVQKSKLTIEQSKARRLWSQMSTAFRNEKFRKHIEKLEGSKSTLLHAKLQAHGSLHHHQLNGIKTIQESLNRTATEHSGLMTKSSEVATQIQADIQTLPTRVVDVVVKEVSTTMAKSHATCSTILTEVRASSIKSDQTNEEIKRAIQSLLSNPDTSRIAALLQPALEKVISDQIASSMESLTAHLASSQPNIPIRTLDPDGGPPVTVLPGSMENQIGVRSLNQLSATTTSIRWAGSSRVINFWFGRLIISTSSLEKWQGRGNGETLQKAEFLETRSTLIPAKWLLRQGVVIKIKRLVSSIVAPSIQVSLTPIMVISEDHEILAAMRYGDLTRVQQMILAGEVHPGSILPDGTSLLHACVADMRGIILPDLEFYDRYEKDLTLHAPDLSQETLSIIYGMIEIAVWLVAHGAVVDAPNIHGQNAFAVLDEIYSADFDTCQFAEEHSDELDLLTTKILQASNSSPFFVRNPGSGQLKMTDTLISSWNYYLDIIAADAITDVSTTFCLTLLQSLWGSSPYNQSYQSVDCYAPEVWVQRLSRAAIAGKLWLAGDDRETKRCLHMLYCSIRDALVYASPYCQSDGKYYYRRQRFKMKVGDRIEIIDAIAEMLRYERDISLYEGSPRLTEYANTWRCLDIWKLALEKAGCQSLPSAIWCEYSHFYDPIGFVSGEPGSSVSLTGDPISHKVILAVGERQYGWNYRIYGGYLINPEFKELTQGWQCDLDLPRVHCEVYPSRTVDTELADSETAHSPPADGAHSTSKYTFKPMEDGGIELFIDICEAGEPWERMCAEIEKELEQVPDGSKDSYPKPGDESIDPDVNGDEMDGASPGVLSKIAGFGLDVMSAIV